jgi:hypothetical protein
MGGGTCPEKKEEDDLTWIRGVDYIHVSVYNKRIIRAGMTFKEAFSPEALNVGLHICHHERQI